jgi:hypothetical protein
MQIEEDGEGDAHEGKYAVVDRDTCLPLSEDLEGTHLHPHTHRHNAAPSACTAHAVAWEGEQHMRRRDEGCSVCERAM